MKGQKGIDAGSKYTTPKFIQEVQTRPLLWNLSLNADRKTRRNGWMELAEIFWDKPNGSASDKVEYAKLLQQKWNNIRGTYNRDVTSFRAGITQTASYKYFQYLSFLDPNLNIPNKPSKRIMQKLQFMPKKKTNENEIPAETDEQKTDENKLPVEEVAVISMEETSENEDPLEEPENTTQRRSARLRRTRKIRGSTSNGPSLNQSKTNVCSMCNGKKDTPLLQSDPDLLFLLSMTQSLKEIPQDIRFGVKMQLKQVIQNAISG